MSNMLDLSPIERAEFDQLVMSVHDEVDLRAAWIVSGMDPPGIVIDIPLDRLEEIFWLGVAHAKRLEKERDEE